MINALTLPRTASYSLKRLNKRYLFFSAFSFFVVIFIFSIFQITTYISSQYLLKNYQEQIQKLAQENRNLEVASLRNISLENIEEKISEIGFEKVDKIHYIQVLEATAKR